MWESRVLRRAFERLELHEGKLSRAVLRGGGGGDVTSLPDGATRSYGCTCYDWSYDQDVTQCATTDTLPRRAAGVTWRCEALGTT